MDKAMNRIKQAWEENPIAVIAVASLAATAAAKLLDASTNRVNAQAWKKEVNRRDRMSK
jgi:dTDP-4-dehydrorhamnose reductase